MDKAWDLIKNKAYQAAIEEYTQRYLETGSTPELRNRGTAYLLVQNYAAALADAKLTIELTEDRFRNDGDYLRLGTCYWHLNEPTQAVAAWQQGLTMPYTDAAGGVCVPATLLYAGERLNDEELRTRALSILEKHWRNHQRRVKRQRARNLRQTHEDFVHPGLFGWPGAIVPFLLGEIDTEILQEQVNRTAGNSDTLRARYQCQADFYQALGALRQQDWAGFQIFMKRCSDNPVGGLLEDEYYLALWEVKRRYPIPAFQQANDHL
jgi:hypothetical protein